MDNTETIVRLFNRAVAFDEGYLLYAARIYAVHGNDEQHRLMSPSHFDRPSPGCGVSTLK